MHAADATPTRRTFLQTTAASATAAAATLTIPAVHAAGANEIKVALIGCGGRGGGAALNILNADPTVKIWAACDIFADRIEPKLKELRSVNQGKYRDRIDVPAERCFSGFDGYKQAIDCGVDVVILATSPGFRPIHFKYAIEKDKHVFMEKPHAVDATGARSVLETAKLAEKKKLGVCAGFTYRYDIPKRETMKRIHDGAIGQIQAIHTTFLTGELWYRGNEEKWSPMEKQIRNWYYYNWLSGDFIVEQAIHNVDKAAWLMNGALPVAAIGMGGRQVRTDEKWGNIWDHFTVVYEYENGSKVFLQCRQTKGCQTLIMDHVLGTKGQAQIMKHEITPLEGKKWTAEPSDMSPYDVEHAELIQSIKAGKPMNDAVVSAHSTLMGILGREAAYTGQRITWDQILNSKQSLVPTEFAWGPHEFQPVAMPGKTKFV